MEYFDRELLSTIKKWIDRREILAIKGPRQTGKTTLLEMIKEWLEKDKNIDERKIISISFEDRELLENFYTAPLDFIKRYIRDEGIYYFLIDEVQYCKDAGQKLKLIYDSFKNIKVLITGSSSLELISETAKYLVGRLFAFELYPLNFYEFLKVRDKNLAAVYQTKKEAIMDFLLTNKNFEISKNDIFVKELLSHFDEYLTFGGYPEVVKARSAEEKILILKNIFNTYLEKDIISYLQITDTIKFRKLINMLASIIGNLVTYEELVTACGSYYKEIVHLLDVLQQTYILDAVRPFYKNLSTELRKNPKVYFYDTGIRNYAINNFNSLERRSDTGQVAENFIYNELKSIGVNSFINYWRTTTKTEVDFVLWDQSKIIPVEVKFTPFKIEKITRSLHSFIQNYKPKTAIVVTKNFWGEKRVEDTIVRFIPIVYI
jgi:uncharacterized protein